MSAGLFVLVVAFTVQCLGQLPGVLFVCLFVCFFFFLSFFFFFLFPFVSFPFAVFLLSDFSANCTSAVYDNVSSICYVCNSSINCLSYGGTCLAGGGCACNYGFTGKFLVFGFWFFFFVDFSFLQA
jgi:hypothetical protein